MNASDFSVDDARDPSASSTLAADVRAYVADSYPHNHGYRVVGADLRPKLQLRWRAWRLRKLYPRPLTSLVDLSCSKGYFVLAAAREPSCSRALGIDVHAQDLAASRAVQAHLLAIGSPGSRAIGSPGSRAIGSPGSLAHARFESMRLHELAARIHELGGPFQTVLLVNAYQYLYFGSRRCPDAYKDHDAIFGWLRCVCAERVIFNNRVEFARVRGLGRRIGAQERLEDDYSSERILRAAARHFRVTPSGRLGRNPLWVLDAR